MRRMRAKTCKTQVTPDIRKFFTNVTQKRFKNYFLCLISRTRVHVSSPKSLNEANFFRGSAGREINGPIRHESTNVRALRPFGFVQHAEASSSSFHPDYKYMILGII